MKSQARWFEDRGLKLEKWQADALLKIALNFVRLSGNHDLAKIVFDEACFQAFDLPNRTERFQEQYLKANL